MFGLLLAYALYFPNRVIVIIFLPFIRIPARTFVLGYGIIELFLGVTNTTAGVAHFAHLGGLFGGWLGGAVFSRTRGVRQTLIQQLHHLPFDKLKANVTWHQPCTLHA